MRMSFFVAGTGFGTTGTGFADGHRGYHSGA
nr:MAG TPA: hypothetical protein [Bacteriophage sp.]